MEECEDKIMSVKNEMDMFFEKFSKIFFQTASLKCATGGFPAC